MLRFTPIGIAIAALAVAVVGLATFQGVSVATHTFGDVPTGAFYHDDAETIRQLNISQGCSAAPLLYCPNNDTTRGEMASFLARTASLYRAGYDESGNGVGAGQQQLTTTTPTTIASATVDAPTDCTMIMSGTADWIDDGTANRFVLEWHIDDVLVGAQYDDEGAGSGLSDSLSAITVEQVTEGSYSVELKGWVFGGGAVTVLDVGMFALCVPFEGDGTLTTAGVGDVEPISAAGASEPGRE